MLGLLCCLFVCLFFAVVIGLYDNTVCVWNQTQTTVFYVSQDSMPNLEYSGQTEIIFKEPLLEEAAKTFSSAQNFLRIIIINKNEILERLSNLTSPVSAYIIRTFHPTKHTTDAATQ